MMRTNVLVVGMLVVGVAACSSVTKDEASSNLGIARVAIEETTTRVEISGLDGAGERIAHLSLEKGRFDIEDFGLADGLQMKVEVSGETVEHTSPGFETRALPLFREPRMQGINDFLTDKRVTSALARWNMTFQPRPETVDLQDVVREQATATCTYSTCSGSGTMDCQQGNNYWNAQCGQPGQQQFVCCGNSGGGTAAWRLCGIGAGNPCGTEGGNGCRVCWQTNHNGYCDAYMSGGYCTDGEDNWYPTSEPWGDWN